MHSISYCGQFEVLLDCYIHIFMCEQLLLNLDGCLRISDRTQLLESRKYPTITSTTKLTQSEMAPESLRERCCYSKATALIAFNNHTRLQICNRICSHSFIICEQRKPMTAAKYYDAIKRVC